MTDIITAIVLASAGVCQYGWGITIGDDRQPCSEWADQLVHVTDDDGGAVVALCRAHREQIEAIARLCAAHGPEGGDRS